MPGTKIINILKDDSLEDVLDIFKESPAQEFIFILPKKSRAFSKEEDFAVLANDIEDNNKTVTILTSNQDMIELASKHNIGVFIDEKPKRKSSDESIISNENVIQNVNFETVIEGEESEKNNINFSDSSIINAGTNTSENLKSYSVNNKDDENLDKIYQNFSSYELENTSEQSAQLAGSIQRSRTMADVLNPESEDEQTSVEISQKIEKPAKIEIKTDKHSTDIKSGSIDDIQSIWESRSEDSKLSLSSRKNLQVAHSMLKKKFRFPLYSKKILVFFVLIMLAILSTVIYVSAGSAKITVKPRVDTLDLNLSIHASDGFLSVDPELKQIPGQLFSIEKHLEETFLSTGEKDVAQKAKGKLTVYNNYSTLPQTLIATTRFQSEEGLIFRTLNTITVPGSQVQNGEVVPGKIDVDVIADKAGDKYNIKPGRFTIPAFKERGDLDRYNKYYGESTEAIRDGIIGKAKVVTEKDYLDAKIKIEERILVQTEDELNTQTSGLKILSLFKPTIDNITSTASIDEAANEFTVSTLAKI